MWLKVIRFLIDLYEYFLLILLIILSFVILSKNNSPQVRILQGEIADVFAFIHYPGVWIDNLSNLMHENQELKEENLRLALLNAQLKESYIENQRLREMLSFADTSHLTILPAEVINQGTTPLYNSIMINVGSKHAITPNMAVITNKGIVGKTVSVGDNNTLVQIFLDVNFRLGVKFQISREYGIMSWQPNGLAEVREIAKTAVIYPGEKVLTSGYSEIYPPNIMVGEVIDVRQSANNLFQIATVRPSVNINSIEEVFVVLKK
ncbi:MAG: rod shape-determining protein MreC [Candidatus Marinimicrobia bacterium]|jgi:rod shape-determining protein MreC|nr:rod shape-determining protein MreC [Candidatus Neomarinimicrobiota bacterium]MCK9484536.1 rod shape-determining protein MreC [Candidatus Neomarinimicrobiota bacterium]MCK9559761.1 rod shape-determining protein MreC [Candidatus Neomarinimicrobiota bacterium]MDD5060938.1 rod shape-determining protein MreC [Candidatus Neomarinimicrobiota bacterium]MDD5230481.1 rod shape-determining protein MreC [Candidatus Neomarinimicrobiota bacterium]